MTTQIPPGQNNAIFIPPPPAEPQPPRGTSWRSVPLPADWHIIRPAVLKRDGHRCTWHTEGRRCEQRATDVDHIGDPEDHDPSNLRSLCGPHHRRRSAWQGATARWARQRQATARAKPKHPGML